MGNSDSNVLIRYTTILNFLPLSLLNKVMKSYLAISCLVLVLVLAYATCGTNAANNRVRRSVNFTPSWGKRSGNFEKTGMILERGDKCMDKAAYMSMLIETLKAEMETFGDCLN